MDKASLPPELAAWFAARGWRVRCHQRAMLEAAAAGRHALLLADTGAGKTLAGFLPTLAAFAPSRLAGAEPAEGLHTLYVSPLKALTHDVQRNLLAPINDLRLDIRVESRTGDTPADRKKRQRLRPPHILLTTPESLSLLLSYPESFALFAGLQRVVIDEVHAFATTKRGDLLALALSRLQAIAPAMRRTALSATVGDEHAFRAWLAPGGDADAVTLITGEPGAPPVITIMLPDGERIPWSGHAGRWAIPRIMAEIRRNRTTLIFTNTRFLAEYVFQLLWDINDDRLPIAIHHGSLSREVRRKAEGAMARGELRAMVATASLDLGVDWGDVDCVIQMGAPKGSARLMQRIGRANHRLDAPSQALLVPGNRFEFLESMAAVEAVAAGERDGEPFRPGALDVLAQHVMACACAAPFDEATLMAEIRAAGGYGWVDEAAWARLLDFVATGGYALRAYDRFRRILRDGDGRWRLAHPDQAARHRLNAGIIIDSEMVELRFRNGRKLGRVEERFAATLSPGDCFAFAGQALEVEAMRESELIVRATRRAAMIPSYGGQRMPLTTHLATRVQSLLVDRAGWARFPDDVREWLEMQGARSALPAPGRLLVETFPHRQYHYCVCYSFEGWNANQSLAMLLARRMEARGLQPAGFVVNDYGLALWGLQPVEQPGELLSPDILVAEFEDWVQGSWLLRRAFREAVVIAGLVERQQPGTRKSARQVSFSTDLIFDVLRRHDLGHVLLEAAWAEARSRLTDVARLADLLDNAAARMEYRALARVSPLAVPLLAMIGRESVPGGAAEDALLLEAESLAGLAMRPDMQCSEAD